MFMGRHFTARCQDSHGGFGREEDGDYHTENAQRSRPSPEDVSRPWGSAFQTLFPAPLCPLLTSLCANLRWEGLTVIEDTQNECGERTEATGCA